MGDLHHRSSQPRHGLDRVGDRLRRAQGPPGPQQRVRAGPPGRLQLPDALAAGPQRRARAAVPGPRDAARLRRDAGELPDRPARTSRSARPGMAMARPIWSSCRSWTTTARSSACSPSARWPAASSARPARPRRCEDAPTRSRRSSGARGRARDRRGAPLSGRVWVHSMDPAAAAASRTATSSSSATAPTPSGCAIELGAALVVLSNGSASRPTRSLAAGPGARHRDRSSRRWTAMSRAG